MGQASYKTLRYFVRSYRLLLTRMASLTSIYRLELEHGKYFVGASTDPVKALEEHREGLGCAWTTIHRPLRIVEVVGFVREGELDTYVRKWMLQYGVDHVRGGSWEHVRLLDKDRHTLCGELTRQRGCLIC
jgi:predicted GIY-YIG superfamily endonuclease